MSILIFYCFFLIGILFGSFYNVVGLRVPNQSLFKKKRSYCPHCHHTLRWYELIPIFSYIIQRGKCRNCKRKISIIYPFVELITGILFAYSYYYIGLQVELIMALLFVSLLVIITVSDVKYMLIPNRILIFFLPLFIILRIGSPLEPWYDFLLGGMIGYAIIALIILLSKGGMGAGDMKLMGVLGIVLGWKGILLTLFFASLFGSVLSLFLITSKLVDRKKPIPFGPYIALGAITVYFFGNQLIELYLSTLV